MDLMNESQIRSGHRGCCGGSAGPKEFCESWGCSEVGTLLGLLDAERQKTAAEQARVARLEAAIRGCLTTRDGWPLCRVCTMTCAPDRPLPHTPECWAVHLLAVAEAAP